MKELEEKIIKEGKLLSGNILKVGSFLNQQVDTCLLRKMAQEVKRLFPQPITKVLTIEASGIAFACAIALEYQVPFIFAKKSKTANVSGDVITADVYSFTHKTQNTIFISSEYLTKNDKVLIADDFLANGEALNGLITLVQKAQAEVVGAVVQIEKEFQNGGNRLRDKGYQIEALASIKEMNNETIKFN